MKYTVSINEAKRSITVTLADGTKGTAKCCPTDRFDLQTGIELALERAKVAQTNAKKACENAPTEKSTKMSVTMLAKQLEKNLPKGHIVVAVGGGDDCLTAEGKAWLAKIANIPEKGCCICHDDGDYYTDDEIDEIKDAAYDDGYNAGYNEATEETMDEDDIEEIIDRVRDILTDTIIP